MLKQLFTQRLFNAFLSQRVKESGERITLWIAIGGYLAHLGLIVLNTKGVISFGSSFFQNPITAIYTPFSFILIYEVYLLIYFLPKSISYYIGKQYEIITLIVIRRIFKDISQLEMSSDWFRQANDLHSKHLMHYFKKHPSWCWARCSSLQQPAHQAKFARN